MQFSNYNERLIHPQLTYPCIPKNTLKYYQAWNLARAECAMKVKRQVWSSLQTPGKCLKARTDIYKLTG